MVIRYPDPAGFPLTGEIRLRLDSMWHSGSGFSRITVPRFSLSLMSLCN